MPPIDADLVAEAERQAAEYLRITSEMGLTAPHWAAEALKLDIIAGRGAAGFEDFMKEHGRTYADRLRELDYEGVHCANCGFVIHLEDGVWVHTLEGVFSCFGDSIKHAEPDWESLENMLEDSLSAPEEPTEARSSAGTSGSTSRAGAAGVVRSGRF